jgi:hypothetical protein
MFADLSLAAALQPITLEAPLLPMAQVLDQIGAQAGVSLKPLRGAERDVVMVRFRGTPLAQVMEDLASAVDGRWLTQGEVRYLEAELPPDPDAGMTLESAQALWKTIKVGPLVSEAKLQSIIDLLRNPPPLNTPEHQRFGQELYFASASFPIERMLKEAALALGPEAIVGMTPGDERTFSAAPSALQCQLPPAAVQVLLRSKTEANEIHRRFSEAGVISQERGQPSLPSLISFYARPTELLSPMIKFKATEVGVLISLTDRRPASKNGIEFEEPFHWAQVPIYRFAELVPTAKTPALSQPPAEHVQEIEQIRRMIQAQRRENNDEHPVAEIWGGRLKGMDQAEPLAGPASAYARSLLPAEGDAILLMPDAALEPMRLDEMFGGGSVMWLPGAAPLAVQSREGLAIVRPTDLLTTRADRLPRAASAALLARLQRPRSPSIDAVAFAREELSLRQIQILQGLCWIWLEAMSDLSALVYYGEPLFKIAGDLSEIEKSAAQRGGLRMTAAELLRRWPKIGRRIMLANPMMKGSESLPLAPSQDWVQESNRGGPLSSGHVPVEASAVLDKQWPPAGQALFEIQKGSVLLMSTRGSIQTVSIAEAAGAIRMSESGQLPWTPVWSALPVGGLSLRLEYGRGLRQHLSIMERWQSWKPEFADFEALPQPLKEQIRRAQDEQD